MKKRISVLFFLISLIFCLTGCEKSSTSGTEQTKKNQKLTIVATLFPQYDFARQIAGDQADVILLLPPGMESHSYEPTPGDMITIQESDLFLYTGDEMEPWAANIVTDLPDHTLTANLSDGIQLEKEEEQEDHEEHHREEEHHHTYNPHIWTSPVLAMKMVENIEQALIQADPDHASFYQENTQAYLKKLSHLDGEFRDIAANAKSKTLFIGSRFSLFYFVEEYGFSYVAAYDSCEEEAEPSIKRVISMIQEMRKNKIHAIYYEELTNPRIANTIAEATDAKPLLFHSCHNVSKDELGQGVTYLSLMEQNVKNLKKGLEE